MIDTKIIEQARQTDIIAFFENQRGFLFTHRGSAYRCRQHPSLAVKNDRLSWYWHSRGTGGYGVLDYLIKIENIPFRKAVETVTSAETATSVETATSAETTLTRKQPTMASPRQEPEAPKTLILPEKAEIPNRVYDYLYRIRGIDIEIIQTLIREKKIYEDVQGNVVFVGYDEHNVPRFASLRGTYGDGGFRMDCIGSDKRYGFHMAAHTFSERLYIYESAIDAISGANLENIITGDKNAWWKYNRLSLAGTSDTALAYFLNKHTTIKDLVFCLDNDLTGELAAQYMADKYAGKGFNTRSAPPKYKDYNEDLRAWRDKARKGNGQQGAVKGWML